jgi:hypothetical protein
MKAPLLIEMKLSGVISIHIVVSWLIKGSKCVNCSLCDQKTNIKGINSITNNMHDERQTHNGNHCFVCDHLFFVQHRTIEDPDNFISISKEGTVDTFTTFY